MRRANQVLLGLALGGVVALAARRASSGGDDAMSATAPVDSSRPAIDRRVPGKLETATFALG